MQSKIGSYLKLSCVSACYAFPFYQFVKFWFWCAYIPRFTGNEINVLTLLTERDRNFALVTEAGGTLIHNFLLMVLFGVQHSFFSRKRVQSSFYWTYVHHQWRIDKALYNLLTGIVLMVFMRFWERVPITLWNIQLSENLYWCYIVLHVIMGFAMFGEATMIDFPDLMGIDQVTISQETYVPKSPELKNTIEAQRHLGLLPLSIILLVHPCMTLDRAFLALMNYFYIYETCNSHTCLRYAETMRGTKLSSKFEPRNLAESFG